MKQTNSKVFVNYSTWLQKYASDTDQLCIFWFNLHHE